MLGFEVTIDLNVQTLSGDSLNVKGELRLQTHDILQKIAREWQIPVSCQQLAFNDAAKETLQRSLNNSAPISVNLLVSTESINSGIQSDSSHSKRKALEDLQLLPKKFKVDAEDFLAKLQNASSRTNKMKLLDILVKREGLSVVADLLCQQLPHLEWNDASFAMGWLSTHLRGTHCPTAIEIFRQQAANATLIALGGPNARRFTLCSINAISALQNLAPSGDEGIIGTLLRVVPVRATQKAAVEALGRLSGERHDGVRAALLRLLDEKAVAGNRSSSVLEAVVHALSISTSSEVVSSALRGICQRHDAAGNKDMVEWAVMKLTAVAPKGDTHATAALCEFLHSGSASLRRASVKALRAFAQIDDARTILEFHCLLQDDDEWIRRSVLLGLGELVHEAGDDLLDAMRNCRSDGKARVREAATSAVRKIEARRKRHRQCGFEEVQSSSAGSA